MVKLDLLVKTDFYACVSGEEDRFTTHLAMMLSVEDVPTLVDFVAGVIVAFVFVDVTVFVWL